MENYKSEDIYNIDHFQKDIKEIIKKLKASPKMSFNDFETVKIDVKQGLYVLWEDEKAMYVGISRDVRKRIRQHFTSKSHYSSSLVYMMAKEKYRKKQGEEYKGKRGDFPFDEYRDKIQDTMKKNYTISIIKEDNTYLLGLSEIYLSSYLETHWNSFKTH